MSAIREPLPPHKPLDTWRPIGDAADAVVQRIARCAARAHVVRASRVAMERRLVKLAKGGRP